MFYGVFLRCQVEAKWPKAGETHGNIVSSVQEVHGLTKKI